jgi:hypothetical protein
LQHYHPACPNFLSLPFPIMTSLLLSSPSSSPYEGGPPAQPLPGGAVQTRGGALFRSAPP